MATSDENTKKLEAQLEKLDDKLDKLVEHVGSIDKTLVRNTVTLEVHVKRTNALENRMEPVEVHVTQMRGAVSFLKILALVLAIITGIAKVLKWI
jgi:hypothetical protein